MNYITTTKLRTNTTDIVTALMQGKSIDLIHRSEVIGEISPKRNPSKKIINSANLQQIIDELNLPRLTIKEIDRRYRSAMMKKHGQGLR